MKLDGFVRVSQIITVALIMGVVVFLGVALVVRGNEPPAQDALIAVMAVGFSAVAIVLRYIIPTLMTRVQIQQWKDRSGTPANTSEQIDLHLLNVFQSQHIIGLALLEGAGFFCLVAYLVTGRVWLLGSVAVLVALMAISFPTRSRIENWILQQREAMRFE